MTIDLSFLNMNCLLSVLVILAQPISASSGSIISLLHVVSPSISGKINTIQTDTREANSLNLIQLKKYEHLIDSVNRFEGQDSKLSENKLDAYLFLRDKIVRGKHYYHALRFISEQKAPSSSASGPFNRVECSLATWMKVMYISSCSVPNV